MTAAVQAQGRSGDRVSGLSLQSLGDTVRDVFTNVRGTFEMLENVVSQLRPAGSSRVERDLNGKVCIVTGGNTGIGRGTSQALVARGAHVILACVDKAQAKEAAKVAQVDLASLASVKSFASNFNARGLPLDVLVCNAGIMAPPNRYETEDGLEQQFQVNYLGHWLLTHQLLKGQQNLREKQMRFNSPNLVRAARTTTASSKVTNSNAWEPEHLLTADASGQASDEGTRVVLVSSMAHRAGRIQFDDLHAQKTYNPFRRYADSKLALLLALKAFAERTQRPNHGEAKDTVVAVHPGLIQTALAKQWVYNESPVRAFKGVANLMYQQTFLPPAYAVDTVMHAITAPANKVHGKYIERSRAVRPARLAMDDAAANRLWDVSCQLTGIDSQLAFQAAW